MAQNGRVFNMNTLAGVWGAYLYDPQGALHAARTAALALLASLGVYQFPIKDYWSVGGQEKRTIAYMNLTESYKNETESMSDKVKAQFDFVTEQMKNYTEQKLNLSQPIEEQWGEINRNNYLIQENLNRLQTDAVRNITLEMEGRWLATESRLATLSRLSDAGIWIIFFIVILLGAFAGAWYNRNVRMQEVDDRLTAQIEQLGADIERKRDGWTYRAIRDLFSDPGDDDKSNDEDGDDNTPAKHYGAAKRRELRELRRIVYRRIDRRAHRVVQPAVAKAETFGDELKRRINALEDDFMDDAQGIEHPMTHTNQLWIDLEKERKARQALEARLDALTQHGGVQATSNHTDTGDDVSNEAGSEKYLTEEQATELFGRLNAAAGTTQAQQSLEVGQTTDELQREIAEAMEDHKDSKTSAVNPQDFDLRITKLEKKVQEVDSGRREPTKTTSEKTVTVLETSNFVGKSELNELRKEFKEKLENLKSCNCKTPTTLENTLSADNSQVSVSEFEELKEKFENFKSCNGETPTVLENASPADISQISASEFAELKQKVEDIKPCHCSSQPEWGTINLS
ncbi:uncharacterized protein BDZ99DRAFT_571207 [Mytilinidion resinicola]|uniref:Uncharacterized protein n=1 Tax=Mytilinidion resinicola TaxID=574789 RepID=A0A6A6YLF6_9PEZI|nr:uncharacterized protein BDZ99DRAFT_571207 [Mytilinidion resinicola]KAF2809368.1 hypothetical protein BDZ99DRAFT_571207 [Mytilinidion resinicola]